MASTEIAVTHDNYDKDLAVIASADSPFHQQQLLGAMTFKQVAPSVLLRGYITAITSKTFVDTKHQDLRSRSPVFDIVNGCLSLLKKIDPGVAVVKQLGCVSILTYCDQLEAQSQRVAHDSKLGKAAKEIRIKKLSLITSSLKEKIFIF